MKKLFCALLLLNIALSASDDGKKLSPAQQELAKSLQSSTSLFERRHDIQSRLNRAFPEDRKNEEQRIATIKTLMHQMTQHGNHPELQFDWVQYVNAEYDAMAWRLSFNTYLRMSRLEQRTSIELQEEQKRILDYWQNFKQTHSTALPAEAWFYFCSVTEDALLSEGFKTKTFSLESYQHSITTRFQSYKEQAEKLKTSTTAPNSTEDLV